MLLLSHFVTFMSFFQCVIIANVIVPHLFLIEKWNHAKNTNQLNIACHDTVAMISHLLFLTSFNSCDLWDKNQYQRNSLFPSEMVFEWEKLSTCKLSQANDICFSIAFGIHPVAVATSLTSKINHFRSHRSLIHALKSLPWNGCLFLLLLSAPNISMNLLFFASTWLLKHSSLWRGYLSTKPQNH